MRNCLHCLCSSLGRDLKADIGAGASGMGPGCWKVEGSELEVGRKRGEHKDGVEVLFKAGLVGLVVEYGFCRCENVVLGGRECRVQSAFTNHAASHAFH